MFKISTLMNLFPYKKTSLSESNSLSHGLNMLSRPQLSAISDDQLGFSKFQNMRISGELRVIHEILPRYIKSADPMFIDVGAHLGNYSQSLKKIYPESRLYCFEPNPVSFKLLNNNLKKYEPVKTFPIALLDQSSETILYDDMDSFGSPHASLLKEALTEICKKPSLLEHKISTMSLDAFCVRENIVEIDFLKVDAEGYDLDVLRGASKMIAQNKIKLIQFEFSELCIPRRIFIKDFFDLLKDYHLYRINTHSLVRLPRYNCRLEVFLYQNILAVRKDLPFSHGAHNNASKPKPEGWVNDIAKHWMRIVLNKATKGLIQSIEPEKKDTLEISGDYWKQFPIFKTYQTLKFPEFDIQNTSLENCYDLVIAEQVFEHLIYPRRACINVLRMLRPGGYFLITTPFLVKRHGYPLDCTRWTETGMKYFLHDCGFALENIHVDSWGNRSCMEANFDTWVEYDSWQHSLLNEPDFPLKTWALARKSLK